MHLLRSAMFSFALSKRPMQAKQQTHFKELTDAGRVSDSDHATASASREMVRGVRRVWSTLRSATRTTIKNSIFHLTSVNNFEVKHKISQSSRSGKDKINGGLFCGEVRK